MTEYIASSLKVHDGNFVPNPKFDSFMSTIHLFYFLGADLSFLSLKTVHARTVKSLVIKTNNLLSNFLGSNALIFSDADHYYHKQYTQSKRSETQDETQFDSIRQLEYKIGNTINTIKFISPAQKI